VICFASPHKALVLLIDLDEIFVKVSDKKLFTSARMLLFKSPTRKLTL
jgi:hypothetical protein